MRNILHQNYILVAYTGMEMGGNGNVITGMEGNGNTFEDTMGMGGNGNVIAGMGGNGMKKGFPAHL